MHLKLYLKPRYLFGGLLFISLLIGTLGTTAYGISKLAKAGNPQAKTIISKIRTVVEQVESQPSSTPSPSSHPDTPHETTPPQAQPTKPPFKFLTSITNDLFGTPVPTPFIDAQANAAAMAQANGRCIIKIQGAQYDVSTLRTSHSGGNVFICGTDMTQIYINQHGIDSDRIVPFKLPDTSQVAGSFPETTLPPEATLAPTTIPTPSPTTTVVSTASPRPSTTPGRTPSPTPTVAPTPTPVTMVGSTIIDTQVDDTGFNN